MAVKGTESKINICETILAMFPNAFVASDGKTIRFSCNENGEWVEIAATLTAKKDLERPEGIVNTMPITEKKNAENAITSTQMTAEEKDRLAELMRELNL